MPRTFKTNWPAGVNYMNCKKSNRLKDHFYLALKIKFPYINYQNDVPDNF